MRFASCATLALILVAGSAVVSHAHTTTFTAVLSGLTESPSNNSSATGFAIVTMDLDEITMRVQVNFTGLTGTTTASHIHAATAVPFAGNAGVATQTPTFTGFPLGVISGTYDHTFDLALADTYNPAFITANGGTIVGALNGLDFAMDDGKAYVNIHTSAFPDGEIRGFLVDSATAAPEPASFALMGLGATAFIVRRRSRRF